MTFNEGRRRRGRLTACLTLLTMAAVAACGGADSAAPATDGAERVTVATLQSSSDAPFFIAQEKGYFAEEGLVVEFIPFRTSTEMTGPLGQGQVDVGGGGLAAAMFNAVARGANLKIVADKGTNRTGYGYPLMVEASLVDSGEVRTVADLATKTFSVSGQGAVLDYLLAKGLEGSGLSYQDMTVEGPLPFPDTVNAFANKAIDAAIVIEPFATQAIQRGVAEKLAATDEWANNETLAVTLFSGQFADERRDVAVRFMTAYIKAVRFYLGALQDGRFAGPNAPEVIDILIKHTPVKDRAVYEQMTPTSNDPDARVNLDGVRAMLEFWKANGFMEGPDVAVEDVVDMSFVDAALQRLPPD